MHIKELFTVPKGSKVTEKVFRKVLLSSICSILLCVVCLCNTTWAWFVADIENSGNEIQLANVSADVTVSQAGTQMGETADGSYSLTPNSYTVDIQVNSEANSPVYLVMSVTQNDTSLCYAVPFAKGTSSQARQLTVQGTQAAVSFSTSWIKPDGAQDFPDGELTVNVPPAEPATQEETPTVEP